jgi:hypothetical protein
VEESYVEIRIHDIVAPDNRSTLSQDQKNKKGSFFLLPFKVKDKADEQPVGYIHPLMSGM